MQIEKLLEEQDKYFEEISERQIFLLNGKKGTLKNTIIYDSLLNWHKQSLKQLIDGLVEKLEGMKKERPVRSLEDLALGLAKFEQLSERDQNKIQNRDNGFYVENIEYVVHNQAIDKQIFHLKEIRKQLE